MKPTDCYYCGSAKKSKLFKQQGHNKYLELLNIAAEDLELYWYICDNCGLAYRSPTLSKKEHETLYERYHQATLGNMDPHELFQKITNLPKEESENYQKIKWMNDKLTSIDGSIYRENQWSVLDVGCGTGTLLYSLSKQMEPDEMYGVEPNQQYAGMAESNLSAKIAQRKYSSNIFNETFDLILCTKLLEHLRDPIKALKEMSFDLAADGRLFIEVPHMNDMLNFSPDSNRFSIPHLYYFDEWSMYRILNEAGWGIETYRVTTTHRDRSYLQIIATTDSEESINATKLGQRPRWREEINLAQMD